MHIIIYAQYNYHIMFLIKFFDEFYKEQNVGVTVAVANYSLS
jgi:hypothetical protein